MSRPRKKSWHVDMSIERLIELRTEAPDPRRWRNLQSPEGPTLPYGNVEVPLSLATARETDIPPLAIRVYAILRAHAGQVGDIANIGRGYLEYLVDRKEGAVGKALASLERHGYIKNMTHGKHGTYRIER